MTYHLKHDVYAYGEEELNTIRDFKDSARWEMGKINPSFGDIPEWNENPEAYAAYEGIAKAARELEKAYIGLLAVYERQELSDSPEMWEYASSRRSA